MKKLVSFVLALVLAASLLPVQVWGATVVDSGNCGLMVDVKTHGEDLALLGKTFHRDGYVQSGWQDKEGTLYDFGDVYTTDANVTMYPVLDKIITLNVPFTTTVTQRGNAAPGKMTFELAIVGTNAGDADVSDVTVSGFVTTNGTGSYDGTLTLTGPSSQLWNLLCEGAFVQQVDEGKTTHWNYDHIAWGLLLWEIPVYSNADSAEFAVIILPAFCEQTDDGVSYDLDREAEPLEKMSFTNTGRTVNYKWIICSRIWIWKHSLRLFSRR